MDIKVSVFNTEHQICEEFWYHFDDKKLYKFNKL